MDPWPLDSTKRSRLAHCGLLGLWRRWRAQRATAMSAIPMGAPGWPELACWTASMARARMALAMVSEDTPVWVVSAGAAVAAGAASVMGAPSKQTPDFNDSGISRP